ncbi:hypothetical protein V8E54_011624 [Elaphomyces granulatus]
MAREGRCRVDRSRHDRRKLSSGRRPPRQAERAFTHPQSAGPRKRTRTYIKRQRMQDQSGTWRALETIGKDLFHDQAVEVIRQRATMITSTHSRIHHQPPLYKATNHQSLSLPPKQQRPYMEADFEGLDPEVSPTRRQLHDWKLKLGVQFRRLSWEPPQYARSQRWFNKCCKATAGPRWEPGEDLRSTPRDIHKRTTGTSQIAENADVDKPIRP